MADRRGVLVPLLILAFIFFSPDPASQRSQRLRVGPSLDDAITEEQRSLVDLNTSHYQPHVLLNKHGEDLNLTGLEPDRGYAWEALPLVQEQVRQRIQYALGGKVDDGRGVGGAGSTIGIDLLDDAAVPLYRNVTGFVHGQWVQSKLDISVPQLNLSAYAPEGPFGPLPVSRFSRNITAEDGDVRIRFHEKQRRDVPASSVPRNVTEMEVEVTLSETSTGEEHDMRMYGVYYPTAGHAILTTTSSKYAGIFALPHLTYSERMFEATRTLLNSSISRTIQRQIDRETVRFNPWSVLLDGAAEPTFSNPECELIIYLQQLPPVSSDARSGSAVMEFLERELRFPTGAFIPRAPVLRFSMLAFSPDCGYVLESKGPPDFVPQDGVHLTGPKVEVLQTSSRYHLLFFTFCIGMQLILLKRQMREASTPSTRSRISFYTIALLSLGDGFATMTFLLISLFIGSLWVNLVGTAFLAFISVSFFGMRFLMDIWQVQLPERIERMRAEIEEDRRRSERYREILRQLQARQNAIDAATAVAVQNGPPTDPPATNVDSPGTAPPPPTTSSDAASTAPAEQPTAQSPPPSLPPPPADVTPPQATIPPSTNPDTTPVFMPSDQDSLLPIAEPAPPTTTNGPINIPASAGFGAMYSRFYLLLLATLFLSLNAASWPAPIRRTYFTLLAFLYLSFWVPQITRNVQRNCRRALNWEFVAGQSVLRLAPFAYFYGYRDNVAFAALDYASLAFLVVWLWLQVLVLVSQELVGPRWFIRKDWAPPAYDYHPVLREDEEGSNMPVGFSDQAAPASGDAESESGSSPVKERRSSSPFAPRRRRSSASASATATLLKDPPLPRGKRVFDCAICMQDLVVPVVEDGAAEQASGVTAAASGPAGLLARRQYMVTPCRHIFHSPCLEGWMKYRLQCPICRETLPPL